jgi:ribosomal protein L24E
MGFEMSVSVVLFLQKAIMNCKHCGKELTSDFFTLKNNDDSKIFYFCSEKCRIDYQISSC